MRPAIKTASGKVVPAPKLGMSHDEIGVEGQRGFLHNGRFIDRQAAAKVAKIPGVTSLHSHHLKAYKKRHGEGGK